MDPWPDGLDKFEVLILPSLKSSYRLHGAGKASYSVEALFGLPVTSLDPHCHCPELLVGDVVLGIEPAQEAMELVDGEPLGWIRATIRIEDHSLLLQHCSRIARVIRV